MFRRIKERKNESKYKFIENINETDLKEIELIGRECLPIYYSLEDLESILTSEYYIMYKLTINNIIIGFIIGEIGKNTEKTQNIQCHFAEAYSFGIP